MINVGGYLEYRGGCSVPWGDKYFVIWVLPWYWTHSTVLMMSSQSTQDIPHGTHDMPHGTEHSPPYLAPTRYWTHIIQGENYVYLVNDKLEKQVQNGSQMSDSWTPSKQLMTMCGFSILHSQTTFTWDQICSDPFGIGSTTVRIHSVYTGTVQNWNSIGLFQKISTPPPPQGQHWKSCKKCSVSMTGNPQISPKFCKFLPEFQENHSFLRNSGIPQHFESDGSGILQKLQLSFLEILKFLGTQFSVVHRGCVDIFWNSPLFHMGWPS